MLFYFIFYLFTEVIDFQDKTLAAKTEILKESNHKKRMIQRIKIKENWVFNVTFVCALLFSSFYNFSSEWIFTVNYQIEFFFH